MRRVSGMVFAGGKSSRFGSDKFMFPVDGVPMGVRSVQALTAVCTDAVWLQGGEALHEHVAGVPRRMGWREGSGPLGALLDALETCDVATLVTLPCDVPGITGTDVQRLVDALSLDTHVSVACSVLPDGAQEHNWLIAAWSLDALPRVIDAYDGGIRSMHEVARSLSMVSVELGAAAMRNVNESVT